MVKLVLAEGLHAKPTLIASDSSAFRFGLPNSNELTLTWVPSPIQYKSATAWFAPQSKVDCVVLNLTPACVNDGALNEVDHEPRTTNESVGR